MAKQKPTDAELAGQLAAANEQYAVEVKDITQNIEWLEAANETQRRELVHARNEIAAGKPEELEALRKMNDTNVNTIADLRRQLREKGK